MSPDFRDLLAEFNAHGVEFLVVGAHALAAHGLVRATKDLDVWVRPARANAERVIAALAARHHLIQNKKAAGRDQDLLDVKWLERTTPSK
jgi:hypothetical protein